MPAIELFTVLDLPDHLRRKNFFMSLPQAMWVRENCRLVCDRCMQVDTCNVNQWGLIVCSPCDRLGDGTGMFIGNPDVHVINDADAGSRLTLIPEVE